MENSAMTDEQPTVEAKPKKRRRRRRKNGKAAYKFAAKFGHGQKTPGWIARARRR